MRFLAVLGLLIASLNTHAITIMEINTQFMWDHRPPSEGNIVGKKIKTPTKNQYLNKIKFFGALIVQNDADVVALIEIENCAVANDIARFVNQGTNKWKVGCSKGRDSFTGQDVAVLTKFQIAPSTITTFPEVSVNLGSKKIRPSKVVGFVSRDKAGTKHVIIAAHLISKRGGNDLKRLAQAKAINIARQKMQKRYLVTSAILLGDFNDFPGSPVLNELMGGTYKLYNPQDKKDCSYIYRGKCSLIDHILITVNLTGGELDYIDLPEKYSDHHAIRYRKN